MLTCRPARLMTDYFSARRALVDQTLTELASRTGAPAPLAAPLTRALGSAGKRVRGILLIAVGEAFGCRAEKLVRAAAAIEMIHASSLILDDLPSMDDALLRRGAPTLHREFGEDLAILSAVAMLNHAYGLVAQAHAETSPRRWPMQQVVQRVVDAVGWAARSPARRSISIRNRSASISIRWSSSTPARPARSSSPRPRWGGC